MKAEYLRLIASIDSTLSVLRKHWLKAKGDDKRDVMQRINQTLDERLRLMELRDATR